jgi:hypothetical protein
MFWLVFLFASAVGLMITYSRVQPVEQYVPIRVKEDRVARGRRQYYID